MNDENFCRRLKDRIIETGRSGLPEDLGEHLVSCASCRHYVRSLDALMRLLPEGPLYTPSLRAASLRAAEASAPVPKTSRWAFVLVPAGLVFNLVLSVILPAGLFQQILPAALRATPAGAALSFAAAAALGIFSVLVCALSMQTSALKEVNHV
jgi:predicted anti-sigma-YlaC factor YlaD